LRFFGRNPVGESLAIVERYFSELNEAVASRNFAKVLDLFDDDATLVDEEGHKTGKSAILDYHEGLPGRVYNASVLSVGGNMVTVICTIELPQGPSSPERKYIFRLNHNKIHTLRIEEHEEAAVFQGG